MTDEVIEKLNKQIKLASKNMSKDEARFIVRNYYVMQEDRKREDNQLRSLEGEASNNPAIYWLADSSRKMENYLKTLLDHYSDGHTVGEWSKSIIGIGPVISAGLIANIDITRAPTVGHIWSFAGLDPRIKWLGRNKAAEVVKECGLDLNALSEMSGFTIQRLARMTNEKGKITKTSLKAGLSKRPWNADLKTLCWKIGESFVKVSGNEDSLYGRIYRERKQYEQANNEAGQYAEQAANILEEKDIGKSTTAYQYYSKGQLPPAHIQARAKRYTVKLFLSHWHHVAYESHYRERPPKPFAMEHMGHAHYIPVPGWE